MWWEALMLFLLMIVFGILAMVYRTTALTMASPGFLFTDIIVINLAVMALYIGKINFEVKGRPQYIIDKVLEEEQK